MFPPRGEQNLNNLNVDKKTDNWGKDVSQFDYDYIVVGAHVEESLQEKIVLGAYVDFGKLLPKEKIVSEEEGKMDLVIHNGKAFWTPVYEGTNIGNFGKWEQVFHVFANIYT